MPKMKTGFFKKIAIIEFIFISLIFIYMFIASYYRYLIDPITVTIVNYLILFGAIIFVSFIIGKHRNRTRRIIKEIKQSLNYCNNCGGVLNTQIKKRCPHCGYIFLFDDLNVLIIKPL